VTFDGPDGISNDLFDRLTGRGRPRPSGKMVGAEAAGVAVDERGFIAVTPQMPSLPLVSTMILCHRRRGRPCRCSAHKAVHEAKVAAEVAAARTVFSTRKFIPSVAYTDRRWRGSA